MCKNVVYKANGAQATLYNCDEKKMWHKPIEGDFAISAKKIPCITTWHVNVTSRSLSQRNNGKSTKAGIFMGILFCRLYFRSMQNFIFIQQSKMSKQSLKIEILKKVV